MDERRFIIIIQCEVRSIYVTGECYNRCRSAKESVKETVNVVSNRVLDLF